MDFGRQKWKEGDHLGGDGSRPGERWWRCLLGGTLWRCREASSEKYYGDRMAGFADGFDVGNERVKNVPLTWGQLLHMELVRFFGIWDCDVSAKWRQTRDQLPCTFEMHQRKLVYFMNYHQSNHHCSYFLQQSNFVTWRASLRTPA